MKETDHLTHIAATIAAGLIQAQAIRSGGGLLNAKEAVDTYEAVLAELQKRLSQSKAKHGASTTGGKKKLQYPEMGLV